jgi:hypothetical protein
MGKGGRYVGLTILPPSFADFLEIWESESPGTRGVSPGLYRNLFALILYNNAS